MILLGKRRFDKRRCERVEMQCGEDDQVARPLLEHGIEVPDLEMAPHADQQRTLAHAASRAHPRCDPDAALAVHLGRRDEPETPPEQHVARAAFPAAPLQVPVMIRNALPVIDQHAGIVGMKSDEQIIPRRPRLNGDTEMFRKDQFALGTDRRNRTSHEEIIHCACTIN